MHVAVTGGRGFVGSHLVDALVDEHDVTVFDIGLSGDNENPDAYYFDAPLDRTFTEFLTGIEVVFHTAAIGRTPWAVEDPVLCWDTNLMASVKALEACRQANVRRVVLSSSNIVYAAETPYKASKLAMEHAARVYTDLYGLSCISLRYANTYGSRQREDGIGPNVFAALRKSLREEGFINVTGDGEQTRDFIHVSDVVRANILAADAKVTGELDVCSGTNWSMNAIARLLDAEVRHVPEREGDIKHIVQDPEPARKRLGFRAEVPLEDGIWDSFPRETA